MVEQGFASNNEMLIETLLNVDNNVDDLEYIYALQDMLDEVLDLQLDESIYFQPNRDNNLAKGIITRVK